MLIQNGIDIVLKNWATTRQLEFIDFINEHKSLKKASEHFNLSPRTIQNSIVLLKKKAALKGYSPEHNMVHIAPDPFIVKGISTYFNKDGNPAGQWVKTKLDEALHAAAIRAGFEAMAAELPRLAPLELPLITETNLCNLYTLTDCHVGMMAWHKEGGADWDIKIAEATLISCFEQMILSSPPAAVGFVSQLGDFLHSDGMLPVTPTSGHILDQDSRFSKIVAVALRVLRRIIDLALIRHSKVIVLMAEGNHDMSSSIWLCEMFKALYENEPRVQVIDSRKPFYAYQHGKTMLAFHHGHMAKHENLPSIFAAEYSKMWGETTHRHCHMGHNHHTFEKEYRGMTVMQHPTLAARDAYASRHGYVALRQASAITYHKDKGQVARIIVSPDILESE